MRTTERSVSASTRFFYRRRRLKSIPAVESAADIVDIAWVGPSYMLSMRSLIHLISVMFLTLALVAPVSATLNFSALTGSYLTQAQKYDANYTQYAQSLSHYYGDAMAFASNLSAPIARDNLGKFPSLYVGVGMGVSFGKVNSMKSEVDSSIQSSVPSYLAAPAIGFNFGMGFTRQWDLRFSFFPNVPIALSSGALGSNTSAEIKFGTYRARLGYHILEGGFLKPGLTLAGFASYSTGALSLTQTGLNSSTSDSTGTVAFTGTSKIGTSWQYLGIGPELRAWYDLKFFHPFIGYSLGLQVGQYTTGINVTGTMTVTPTSLAPVVDTGSLDISERYAARIITHRLMLGFEINLFILDIGVEAQVDLVNGLVGGAFGTALRF